jgi:AcrR family transcriptional regulator
MTDTTLAPLRGVREPAAPGRTAGSGAGASATPDPAAGSAASGVGPRSAQGKGAQTRQAILASAIARFGRDGYRSTSIADIARDAGVGGTVAYAYFPSKEALFFAAVDEDAAAVIHEGLSSVVDEPSVADWHQTLIFTLVGAVEHHPLARRLLAGLEPDVTTRVLEIPALAELRKACAERMRAEQLAGAVRPDIDPVTIANGAVAITLSLLMSVVQLGGDAVATYGPDVAAVFQAALARRPPGDRAAIGGSGASGGSGRKRRPSRSR